ncbi:MAG: septum formation initiator family protein [Elusimicrobia bacterium]|nr:septum formation initiator family protein [Elusimicrobiota bacterium]
MPIAFVQRHWTRILLSAFLLAVFFGNQGFRSLVRAWIELRHLRSEIVQLEREQAKLSRRLPSGRGGDFALERLARRELGFVKPGEIEYRFPPPAQEAGGRAAPAKAALSGASPAEKK